MSPEADKEALSGKNINLIMNMCLEDAKFHKIDKVIKYCVFDSEEAAFFLPRGAQSQPQGSCLWLCCSCTVQR